MISFIQPPSLLVSPGAPNVFVSSAHWVQMVLLGPLATSIAVIAVASIGLLMLSGRMNVRRGVTVLLGCFILFGAAGLAQGLRSVAGSLSRASSIRGSVQPYSPIEPSLVSAPTDTASADPYAGASIQR